jgi:hypothetical protein
MAAAILYLDTRFVFVGRAVLCDSKSFVGLIISNKIICLIYFPSISQLNRSGWKNVFAVFLYAASDHTHEIVKSAYATTKLIFENYFQCVIR